MSYELEPQYEAIAQAIENYIEEHFWAPHNLMYAYLDVTTGRPFEKEFISEKKACRRALFDPWTWWTYEDTINLMGAYLEGLCRKHTVTGDPTCLEKARRVWKSVRSIYYASQVYGPGSFLRPYGGFVSMNKFVEPLGTDQASPLFGGLFHFMKVCGDETRSEVARVALDTLSWYERQGFSYFYYKDFVIDWDPDFQHGASYFLPSIAWAWRYTGDEKWERHLDRKLALFKDKRFNLFNSFTWGSDLPALKECAGDKFSAITDEMLDFGYCKCLDSLSRYTEPGMLMRHYPESAEPGFKPYLREPVDPYKHHGLAYFYIVHQGRSRPRSELHFLCGMAEIGYPGAFEKAADILSNARQKVPTDFTDFRWEDYDDLPEEVHLYARSIGPILPEWYRDYWMLRGADERIQKSGVRS